MKVSVESPFTALQLILACGLGLRPSCFGGGSHLLAACRTDLASSFLDRFHRQFCPLLLRPARFLSRTNLGPSRGTQQLRPRALKRPLNAKGGCEQKIDFTSSTCRFTSAAKAGSDSVRAYSCNKAMSCIGDIHP
jgi:hypothetical protein